jgi:hypothetical protein
MIFSRYKYFLKLDDAIDLRAQPVELLRVTGEFEVRRRHGVGRCRIDARRAALETVCHVDDPRYRARIANDQVIIHEISPWTP